METKWMRPVRALIQRVTKASVEVGEERLGRSVRAAGARRGGRRTGRRRHLAGRARWPACGSSPTPREDEPVVAEVGGEALVVSQFTLYADVAAATGPASWAPLRPRSARAGREFAAELRALGVPVATGRFGAHMRSHLVNDGPVTIWIDCGDRLTPAIVERVHGLLVVGRPRAAARPPSCSGRAPSAVAQAVQAAAQAVVRVVVGRRRLEDVLELGGGLGVAAHAQVGDAERLADRGLVGLAPLGLLERDGRLGVVAPRASARDPAGRARRCPRAPQLQGSGRFSSRVICDSAERIRRAPVTRSRGESCWRTPRLIAAQILAQPPALAIGRAAAARTWRWWRAGEAGGVDAERRLDALGELVERVLGRSLDALVADERRQVAIGRRRLRARAAAQVAPPHRQNFRASTRPPRRAPREAPR